MVELTPDEISILQRLAADPEKAHGLSETAIASIQRFQEEAIRKGIKDGLKEWLDATYATVGRWTLRGIAALLFAAFIYLIIKTNGFGAVHLPGHISPE